MARVLFQADSSKNSSIVAGGTESFNATQVELRNLRKRGNPQVGVSFNWYEVVNNSDSDIELRFDARTDKNVLYVPAKSTRTPDDDLEVVNYFNIDVVNLDTSNAITANALSINRRLVMY